MTRVLVTRPADRVGVLDAELRAVGIEPVVVPAIAVEIQPPGGPLQAAARWLHTFDWVVVTSANGARAILTAAERVFTALDGPRWAAVGRASADVLEREGIAVDFLPSRSDATALATELPVRRGEEVLLLRGDLAGDTLPRRLRERDADVTDVIAYHTVEAPPASLALLRDAFAGERPAAVLFASGSAVRGLVSLGRGDEIDVTTVPAVCIGPETAREAARHGFEIAATASGPDPNTLAATTVAALAQPLETR